MLNALGLFLSSVLALSIEEPPFQVLSKDKSIEVRSYGAYCTVGLEIDGDLDEVGDKAFRPLFQYISGSNDPQVKIPMTSPVGQEETTGQKIPMTSPVGQVALEGEGKYLVYFVLPMEMSCDDAPKPEDSRLQLIEKPARQVAVITYSGRWTKSNYEEAFNKLQAWLAENQVKTIGPFTWARYNSPFSLWFLRRNEIQVPVQWEAAQKST